MSSSTSSRQDPDARLWGQQKRIAVISTVIGAALIAAGFGFAALHPPALAWVGFGLVSAIVLGLGALAPVGFERTRVSPLPPSEPVDAKPLLLVVADSHCAEAAVCDEIATRIDETVAVHLVVPIRVSHLHFMTDDEVDEQRQAEEVVEVTGRTTQEARLRRHRRGGRRQAARIAERRPRVSLSDAGAVGDAASWGVLLARARPVGEGAPTDEAPNHAGRRSSSDARRASEPACR